MHEYSIINNLLEQCDMYARQNNALCVDKVIVSVGKHSAIDSSLLKSAFETFKLESEFCQNAILVIKKQNIKLECKDCKAQFEPKSLNYSNCAKCGSRNVEIIAGKDILLLSLEIHTKEKY